MEKEKRKEIKMEKNRRYLVKRIACKDQTPGRVNNYRSWSDLALDLLEEIMKNLSWADQIRMRSVSKSWWQLRIQDDGPFHRLPWIIETWKPPYKTEEIICRVYDPINTKEPYISHMISRPGKTETYFESTEFVVCRDGWTLFVIEKYGIGLAEIFLFRPGTKQIVVLPDLSHGMYDLMELKSHVAREFALSSPSDSEEFILFALYYEYDLSGREKIIISTYEQGDNNGWITKRFSGISPPTNAVYYQGGFYMSSYQGALFCYRVADHKLYSLGNMETSLISATDTNLVVTPGGELLFVGISSLEDNCWLFTFDWNLMKWNKRFHLEDSALFLAHTWWEYSFVVPTIGCTAAFANKLFFLNHYNGDVKFYDFNEGKGRSCRGTEFESMMCKVTSSYHTKTVWIEAAPAIQTQESTQLVDKVAQLLKEKPGRLSIIPAQSDFQ